MDGSIKMWLFRNQFQLNPRTTDRRPAQARTSNKLLRVCLFAVTIYVRYWYTCNSAVHAPRNDLKFLQALSIYPDQEVSNLAVTAFSRHLWYLSEVPVGLALFDTEVSNIEKRQMLRNMETNPGSEDPPKRVVLPVNLGERRLSNFCTTATRRLFEILSLDSSFLTNEPEEWLENESF
ncbi:hypothetical protein SNE40_020749 [Patella caerulea]|uniref:Uncharacterized protein n=1 Tax=Patella caerulea TaxID=87958 RepID=A0AAN8J4X9_PATCE